MNSHLKNKWGAISWHGNLVLTLLTLKDSSHFQISSAANTNNYKFKVCRLLETLSLVIIFLMDVAGSFMHWWCMPLWLSSTALIISLHRPTTSIAMFCCLLFLWAHLQFTTPLTSLEQCKWRCSLWPLFILFHIYCINVGGFFQGWNGFFFSK